MINRKFIFADRNNPIYTFDNDVFVDFYQNFYIEENVLFFIEDKNLFAFFDIINENLTTEDFSKNFENLVKTNCVNNDLNYVREVNTFPFIENENLNRKYQNINFVNGDGFAEFFYGEDRLDLIKNLDDFKLVKFDLKSNEQLEHLANNLIKADKFSLFLKNSFENFEDLEIIFSVDKNNNLYYVFSNSYYNLIVSEKYVEDIISIDLDLVLDYSLEEHKNDSKTKLKNLSKNQVQNQINLEQQKRLILKEFLNSVNNEEDFYNHHWSELRQLLEMSVNFIANPYLGTLQMGNLALAKVSFYSLETFFAEGCLNELTASVSSNLFTDVVNMKIEGKLKEDFLNTVNTNLIQSARDSAKDTIIEPLNYVDVKFKDDKDKENNNKIEFGD